MWAVRSFPTCPKTVNPEGLARIGFGNGLYDEQRRQLELAGTPVDLSHKAFELLGLLLKNRPRAMSKIELRDALWPTTFVADNSLAKLVTEIRDALGDDARAPRLIRTLYGFGYAFCGEATDLEPPGPTTPQPEASYWLLSGRNEVALLEGENLIGRDPECRVRINSPKVSRRHARVIVAETQATVEDLGSKNGTYLERELVEEAKPLTDGDEISVGPALFVFRTSGTTATTQTETARRSRRASRPTTPEG